jgi:branched-chain amino acid transport system substrate-binding protein
MGSNEIRIGVLATLMGPYAGMGEDAMRGVDLALSEFGGTIAGRRITVLKEGTNATPDYAETMAEVLIRRQGAEIILGPLSGNEGLAVWEYAASQPNITFVNGNAAAQQIGLNNTTPNFFSFVTNGVQYSGGLAEYIIENKGYRRLITLGEDYSYPHAQIGAFTLEFCRGGGHVLQKFWVPLGTSDFSNVIRAFPANIDAIYVVLAGTDALNFVEQYHQHGGRKPLVGGAVMNDLVAMNISGAFTELIVGMVASGPIADNNPSLAWQNFVQRYRQMFPRGLTSPSLFANAYYTGLKAVLLALQLVDGDLSDGQQRFQAALRQLEFESPTGMVRLDQRQQVVANIFITEVERLANGSLYSRLVQTNPAVNQTLGIDEGEFRKIGLFTRDNPYDCP